MWVLGNFHNVDRRIVSFTFIMYKLEQQPDLTQTQLVSQSRQGEQVEWVLGIGQLHFY